MQARVLKRVRANKLSKKNKLKFVIIAERRRRAKERDKPQARQKMQQAIESELNHYRAEVYAFYRSILRNPESTAHEKLLARERMDKLLGLDLDKE